MGKVKLAMREKIKRAIFIFSIPVFLIGSLLGLYAYGLRINMTGSMPLGLYLLEKNQPIERGSWVFVCLPQKLAEYGEERGYLASGMCPHYISPLLKEVIAVPGDNLGLTESDMIVNGQSFYAPVQKFDHNGLPIIQIARGNYPGTKLYWLYGKSDPKRSWDSRYYGGVEIENIAGIAKPIFIYNDHNPEI